IGNDIAKATGDGKDLRITVKLTTQNRQAQIDMVPSASVLIVKALNELPRDRNRKTLSTVEIALLMRLSTLPSRCSTDL
ncbi:60s ribosomal protein l12, partial [Lynx pardinus]